MIYSVWIADQHLYKYYQTKEGFSDDGPVPKPRKSCNFGSAPDEASWQLPISARFVGVGKVAKGVVVHPKADDHGLPELGAFEVETGSLFLIGALGIIAYMFFNQPKEKTGGRYM